MNERSRVPGFWSSVRRFRRKLLSWDAAGAAVAAILVWCVPPDAVIGTMATDIAGAGLAVGSALVGVVVAALAVVVAFMDDEFLALMDEGMREDGGVAGQLFPFWFVTATGVGSLLLGMILLVGGDLPVEILRGLSAAVAALFVWTALGVLNLVAWVQATGATRAIHARGRLGRRHSPDAPSSRPSSTIMPKKTGTRPRRGAGPKERVGERT